MTPSIPGLIMPAFSETSSPSVAHSTGTATAIATTTSVTTCVSVISSPPHRVELLDADHVESHERQDEHGHEQVTARGVEARRDLHLVGPDAQHREQQRRADHPRGVQAGHESNRDADVAEAAREVRHERL